ncbi:hypothetical protein NDA16_004185 [Ustilago loliicola]|nr:hypothetical protein NDA16_004185 [Ustilago loliicola]
MLQLDTPQLHNKVPTPSPPAESTHCHLPDANQDAAAAAAPLDPKIAVQLGHFNLCLVEHPKLLVCTISSCPHKLPIIPTVREITAHLKTHSHAMVSSSKKALEETLDTLDLESPATVPINMAMLPVNIIKELPVVYKGYCCNMCLYIIKSCSAINVHIKTHDDVEVKARSMSGVSMQVIHKSGQNRRYLHVCNKGLDNAPLPLPLTAANNPSLTAAITTKVDAFLKQNHNAMEEAGMLDKGIQPKMFTSNISPWAKQLNWHAYWASKPVSAIGALGPHPQDWPGAHSDFASLNLMMQQPEVYGQTEQLTLVHIFLHLCLSKDGTPKPVNAATSIIVSMEFALCAVLHSHLLDAENGMIIAKPMQIINTEVEKYMKCYLHHDSGTASAHLQSLLCYGRVLSKDDSSNFAFGWSKDCDTVTFGVDVIPVIRLQDLMHSALEQAEKLMAKLLLLPNGMVDWKFDIAVIWDNHCNMQPGFSMDHASKFSCGPQLLHVAAQGGVPPAQPLVDPYAEELEFDADAAEVYFAQHNQFAKLLAVIIKLSGGLPARGTELMQLQYINTFSSLRNLFVHGGSVFTALSTTKGTGRKKVIPRFLPHAVGCLVIAYIARVTPFVHQLFNSVIEPRAASAMLLADHCGRAWDTNTVSKALQSLCQQYVSSSSSGLTMHTWRQLAVSIDCTLICPHLAQEDAEDSAHNLQAGHSSSTADQHYGLDASMLHQLMQESMDSMLAVSEHWHAFWSLPSRFDEPAPSFCTLISTATTAKDHSGVLDTIKHKLDVVEDQLRSIKQKLDQPTPAAVLLPAVQGGSSQSAVLPAPVSNSLYKVTGSHCTKTVEQAYALNAIYSKQSLLIIIMATGSGKSALFMAPLHWLLPASVVVVIVPFIALMGDLLEQCSCAGISASKWSGYDPVSKVGQSQLIFVAAENCYSSEFGGMMQELVLQELVQQEQLAAIFFDECHVVLTQSCFHPAMTKVKALMTSVPAPQHFLTATMPLSMLNSFKAELLLPQDGTGVIRASTNHKNISYAVELLTSAGEMQFSLNHHLESVTHGAVMVICKSKAAAEAAAGKLGCWWVASDMQEKDKHSIISAWLQCLAIEDDNRKPIISIHGTIKRCMGDKAKGIACYTCLVPMKICSGGSLAGGGKCRCTYADIFLPVVAAVIHDRELQSKSTVFRQLGVEVLDVNNIESELGTVVTYQGQRVFLAFAIFGAAVDVTM